MDLELLSPARNASVGIAAIDCGADAVYIAGPSFGARQGAGNPVSEIRRLSDYAHRFGARVFVTVNTIVYDDELPAAAALLKELAEAGADAFIVQDLGIASLCRSLGLGIPLHASTQCAIRTPERARFYEALGFSRLVLERELPLEVIREIRAAVGCELEFFVHGALCVCYSGQCYLSEYLTGRSANRGACVQACRRVYDLETPSGEKLFRGKALLSLKDYNLLAHMEELADEGICSFKIEGRLKGTSYVSNVTKAYSEALDKIVASRPEKFSRSSFGKVRGGFMPSLEKTFNRGYTSLFFSPERRGWSSMDIPKSSGERVGKVRAVREAGRNVEIVVDLLPGVSLSNGDGFCFSAPGGAVEGFRADICRGDVIVSRPVPGLGAGMELMRNISAAFEKEIQAASPERLIDVSLNVRVCGPAIEVEAVSEDGRRATLQLAGEEPARDTERMLSIISGQLSKRSGIYSFSCHFDQVPQSPLPLLSASSLNALRRSLAGLLDAQPVHSRPMQQGSVGRPRWEGPVSAAENIANHLAEKVYSDAGATSIERAYEISRSAGIPLMRSAYCIRRELGLCPRQSRPARMPDAGNNAPAGDLILRDVITRRPLRLHFDCSRCEMTVLSSLHGASTES
ncbi:MAG: U32 family peptidase [Bacteroidales bacterium]|nr:U32 family peptidase [Bacteroidales bacterium]